MERKKIEAEMKMVKEGKEKGMQRTNGGTKDIKVDGWECKELLKELC